MTSGHIADISSEEYDRQIEAVQQSVPGLRAALARAEADVATAAQARDLAEVAWRLALRDLADARVQTVEREREAQRRMESDAYHGRMPGPDDGLTEIGARLLQRGQASEAERDVTKAEQRYQEATVAHSAADQRRGQFAMQLRAAAANTERLSYDRQRARVLRGEVPPPVVPPSPVPAWMPPPKRPAGAQS